MNMEAFLRPYSLEDFLRFDKKGEMDLKTWINRKLIHLTILLTLKSSYRQKNFNNLRDKKLND